MVSFAVFLGAQTTNGDESQEHVFLGLVRDLKILSTYISSK